MPVKSVYLNSDAYLACVTHALSTEGEEIMGLLLGDVKYSFDTDRQIGSTSGDSYIESVVILQRSDRQADRVEISPLQLSAAAQEAEKLSMRLGKSIRVMGWYHSHPHITVQPSHVDIQTQSNYQGMDPDFIGLILSVFQQDGNEKFASASIICFQSEEDSGTLISKELGVQIVPQSTTSEHCLKALAEIPRTLYNEESDLKKRCGNTTSQDVISDVHNSAVYTQALCQLVECCEMPCISALEAYEKALTFRLQELEFAKRELKVRAKQ